MTNNADVIDGVTAIIDGINPDWIRLERPVMSSVPRGERHPRLLLDIPPTCPAGDYLVIVRIVSTIDADRQTVHDFWLTVTPAPALTIRLAPSIVTGGQRPSSVATVVNTGNTALDLTVDALEPHPRDRLHAPTPPACTSRTAMKPWSTSPCGASDPGSANPSAGRSTSPPAATTPSTTRSQPSVRSRRSRAAPHRADPRRHRPALGADLPASRSPAPPDRTGHQGRRHRLPDRPRQHPAGTRRR